MISVVVPIFNEEAILPELRLRLQAALTETGETWEVLFVNDGSSDGSERLLRAFNHEDRRFKTLSLSRNFGHQPAVTAGLHHAAGACVVLLDGDLQDPPECIPQMVDQWRAGFKVVLGERRSRADDGLRSLGFRLFYPLFRLVTDLPGTPDAGIFGLMDRRVVDEFNRLPERNRFIPGLRSWLGFSSTNVLYDRQERAAGQPKQTLSRLLQYAVDAMFSFSNKPLRAATYMGFVVSIIAFGAGIFYLASFFTMQKQAGSGFTTIIICLLFLGGVQLISVGILGEYIGRVYEEVKQRPLYLLQEKIGFDS